MKCRRCHNTMVKDASSRTARCPYCGRTVSYKTKVDKKNCGELELNYSGCLKVVGITALIDVLVSLLLSLLLLSAVFGSSFWEGIGEVFSFLGGMLWTVIGVIFDVIGMIFGGLIDFIFG